MLLYVLCYLDGHYIVSNLVRHWNKYMLLICEVWKDPFTLIVISSLKVTGHCKLSLKKINDFRLQSVCRLSVWTELLDLIVLALEHRTNARDRYSSESYGRLRTLFFPPWDGVTSSNAWGSNQGAWQMGHSCQETRAGFTWRSPDRSIH